MGYFFGNLVEFIASNKYILCFYAFMNSINCYLIFSQIGLNNQANYQAQNVMDYSSRGKIAPVQLRRNQEDFNFQLHHRLSKFEVPVVVNLKHIFENFGLYTTSFLIQKLLQLIRSSYDGQFSRKGQHKKGGKFELRLLLCYYNCKWLKICM